MPEYPKQSTIRDEKFLRNKRKNKKPCQKCGQTFNIEVAHIFSRGASGPDTEENTLYLCGPASMQQGCHGGAHTGRVTQEDLLEIKAKQLGLTIEELYRKIRIQMGYVREDEWFA